MMDPHRDDFFVKYVAELVFINAVLNGITGVFRRALLNRCYLAFSVSSGFTLHFFTQLRHFVRELTKLLAYLRQRVVIGRRIFLSSLGSGTIIGSFQEQKTIAFFGNKSS